MVKPEALGLQFEPVREQALKAAEQSQDFGQLFLGFSIFLVVAALLLMALLFQFGIEQRTSEIGILLALGFGPKQVRRLFLLEGGGLAVLCAFGVVGGIGYVKAMLWGLRTVWRDAVGPSFLTFTQRRSRWARDGGECSGGRGCHLDYAAQVGSLAGEFSSAAREPRR